LRVAWPAFLLALLEALDRALDLYRNDPDRWREIMLRGMEQDWSWGQSARRYRELYERAVQAA
jgi:starch synthase